MIESIKSLITTLVNFFTKLWDKVKAGFEWTIDLVKSIFLAAWDFVKDGVSWAFDGLLGIVVSALNSLDVSGVSNLSGAWSGLPAEVLNVLGLLGIGQASAVILAAIGIRLLLQLIPFTRLGS